MRTMNRLITTSFFNYLMASETNNQNELSRAYFLFAEEVKAFCQSSTDSSSTFFTLSYTLIELESLQHKLQQDVKKKG